MQQSSSFSESRTGKGFLSKPLSIRTEAIDSLPWPSPSFVVSSGEDGTVCADPGRPSTQIKSSPTGRLPPTPLTATYKPTILPTETKPTSLQLPGVDALLALTPPASDECIKKSVMHLPPAHDQCGNIIEDAPIRTGYSPVEGEVQAKLPTSASKTGLFQGSSSEWAGNHASFALMDRRQIAPRPTFERHQTAPVSPQRFRNMPSSSQVQGLGLDLGEETPRLGSMMMTPTLTNMQRIPGLPGAPNLSGSEGDRFPTLDLSSPVKLPLRQWNTDLYFEHRQYVPRAYVHRSYSDGPNSVAMEREKVVEIEGGLPFKSRTWGLALSTDDGASFRRGDVLHRQDGSVIGPATLSRQDQLATETPTPTAHFCKSAQASTSATKMASTASPSKPSSASKRPLLSTGLTPHIHKTRLTPTPGSSSKARSNKDVEGNEVASPSLKMQSKLRSDQLREQAEFIATQGHLPSDVPIISSSSSPTSPLRNDEFNVMPQAHSRTAPPSISPRNKRVLATRSTDANAQRLDISPWGVFDVNTVHDAWQPLGAPAVTKVLAKMNLSDNNNSSAFEEQDNAKKARRNIPLSDSTASFDKKKYSKNMSIRSSHRSSSGEDKENDVFGTSTTVKKKVLSPPMPSHSTNTRRLVNIR